MVGRKRRADWADDEPGCPDPGGQLQPGWVARDHNLQPRGRHLAVAAGHPTPTQPDHALGGSPHPSSYGRTGHSEMAEPRRMAGPQDPVEPIGISFSKVAGMCPAPAGPSHSLKRPFNLLAAPPKRLWRRGAICPCSVRDSFPFSPHPSRFEGTRGMDKQYTRTWEALQGSKPSGHSMPHSARRVYRNPPVPLF